MSLYAILNATTGSVLSLCVRTPDITHLSDNNMVLYDVSNMSVPGVRGPAPEDFKGSVVSPGVYQVVVLPYVTFQIQSVSAQSLTFKAFSDSTTLNSAMVTISSAQSGQQALPPGAPPAQNRLIVFGDTITASQSDFGNSVLVNLIDPNFRSASFDNLNLLAAISVILQ